MKTIALIAMLCLCLTQSTSLFSQLHINEILADNESGILDAQGDAEDWIEIYNAGSSAVNLAGYYISDDPVEPLLWQIPATAANKTTVAPGGFLLLWADKDTEDGEEHIDLKLGASGETLTLTAADGSTQVDQIIFGPQSTDVSFGRTMDGSGNFDQFATPSPGASNGTTSSALTYVTQIRKTVNSVANDAIEYGVSSGGMNIDHFGMTMTESWSNQKIGLRFDELALPEGAVILEAYLQFTCKSPDKSEGPSDLTIRAEKTDDAEPFQEVNNNISDRELTSSEVNWQPNEWLIKDLSGPEQTTPNLKDLVQEVVDQSGWSAGQAMAFVITGSGERSAHNYTSGFPPTLFIRAEIPGPTTLVENIFVNEVASNGTDFGDETGDFEDWIELYNANNFPVAIGGLYLSDKATNLTKWQIADPTPIPANGYLMIFADEKTDKGGFHADFKISSGGETISLVQSLNNELIVIDQVDLTEVPFKASTGRATDGDPNWEIFGGPTPLAPNNQGLDYLAPPTISLDNGVYMADQSVTLAHSDPSATIRYTMDDSDPDENSTTYNGAITVDETGSIKASAFRSGFAPSQVETRSYLFDPSATLPVLMITTDPDNLYDDEIGIYTVGTNGIIGGFCSNNVAANFWQDWERPANLTLFEPNGEEAFSVNAGIGISGNCSRRYALKSLNIYLRNNQYGDSDIDYKLFPNRDYKKYKRLRLRNSGQDFRSTMMRDGTNQSMLAEVTDVEYQSYRPTLVYINGEYFGIQNFRDLYGGEYFEAFFDVPEEELDLVKSPKLSNDVKEGDDLHYQNLYTYVENNDLSDNANFDYFKTQFDIESFLDYWISMVYMSSSDWPANNLQVWRPRTPDGKWRYMYLDSDATTNLYSSNSTNGYAWDTFSEVLNPNQQGWPFDCRSTLFFRDLLENEAFRDEFIQRTCSFMELILNEDRANEFIDASINQIDAEIGEHVEHWAFDNEYLEDYSDWQSNINKYRSFFEERPAYFYEDMEDHFDLDDQYELTINYDASTNGDVTFHWKNMAIPFNYTGTYYTGLPIRITAEAHEGFQFAYWLETGETSATIDFVSNSDASLTPIFEPTSSTCDPNSPDFEDADNDGVCDDMDECPGFDDTVDLNDNGIPDGCDAPCQDDDGDDVCNEDDLCPGFDDNVDLNGNGIPDGCDTGCTDNDDDGVCAADDCDDNDPDLPAAPGSSCDDGTSSTFNDVYLNDGCTCQGTPVPPTDYCESAGDFPWHDWIQMVHFNDIMYFSGKDDYADNTFVSTVIQPLEIYDLSLTVGYSWETFDEFWGIWIDFNSNQIFEPAEKVFLGVTNRPPNGTDDATLNTQLTMPDFAITDQPTRMRVVMQRGFAPQPCGEYPFGETEDYTVYLGGNGAGNRVQLASQELLIYPVPARRMVTIDFPTEVSVSKIRILDARGKAIWVKSNVDLIEDKFTLNIEDWKEGIYFIQAEVETGKWRYGKMIVTGTY